MADDGKKPITIDKKINLFSERKKKTKPEWFAARPRIDKLNYDLGFKKTMRLDPRKWKKAVIEDGAYAVARSELQLFDMVMTKIEKDLDKAFPKGKKIPRNKKDETKEEAAALDKAANETTAAHKKFTKSISDKVSLALEEVELDKGDNKKAIAAGKEAIKRFDSLDTKTMFTRPSVEVGKTLTVLAKDLEKPGAETSAAFKKAQTVLQKVQKDFDANGRAVQNVAKFLINQGAKMAKDKKADPALQKIGKEISGTGPLKSALNRLATSVEDFDNDLAETTSFVEQSEGSSAEVKSVASKFIKAHGNKDKSLSDSVKAVSVLSKKFNTATKNLKS